MAGELGLSCWLRGGGDDDSLAVWGAFSWRHCCNDTGPAEKLGRNAQRCWTSEHFTAEFCCHGAWSVPMVRGSGACHEGLTPPLHECCAAVERPWRLEHECVELNAYWLREVVGDYYHAGAHVEWMRRIERVQWDAFALPDRRVEHWSLWLDICAEMFCPCDAPAVADMAAMFYGAHEEPCECGPLPPSVGQLGRTLRFARVVWCAVAASAVDSAADFFTFMGGMSVVVAHALGSTPGRKEKASFWGWELHANHAHTAAEYLGRGGIDVRVVSPRWYGEDAYRSLERLAERMWAERHDANVQTRWPAVQAVIVQAPPFPYWRKPPTHMELIGSPCTAAAGDIEFLVLDPPYAFVPEFTLLVEKCAKLKWVAVNNANLPYHAGWIGRYLLRTSAWHLVAEGHYAMAELGGAVTERHWQVLARADALRQPPPRDMKAWFHSM